MNKYGVLVAALESVKFEPSERLAGVCHNVELALQEELYGQFSSDLLYEAECEWKYLCETEQERLWGDWPLYSGNRWYPVPDPTGGDSPEWIYACAARDHMWAAEHPYGRARLQLVDFLINKLTAWSGQ